MGKLTKYLFYVFLLSIPLGTRFLLHQFTTGFDEYEAVFVYLSDILMLGFLASFFWEFGLPPHQTGSFIVAGRSPLWCGGVGQFWQQKKPLALKIFLILAFVSIFTALSHGIAVYNFIRLILLAATASVAAKMLKMGIVKFEGILAVLAGSAVVQALIGIAQFIKQESLGLVRLGEPIIGPNVGGAAKIIAESGKVLRAYGTFPHPNVLAAFLAIGLLAMYYFWLNRPSEWKVFSGWRTLVSDTLFGVGIFIIILGLTFAFSRAAWAVAALSSLFVISYSLLVRRKWVQAVRLSILLFAITLIAFFGFKNFILPRAQISSGEPAVTQRMGYNDIAIGLIKNNFLGVGIGNQVLYSVKNEVYKNAGMTQVWQWQPVHNIYLLMASEIGILGLLAFLLFVGKLFLSQSFMIHNSSFIIPITMLSALLILGLFDHFLWTLQPGRLMLWLTIGLVMGLTKSSE